MPPQLRMPKGDDAETDMEAVYKIHIAIEYRTAITVGEMVWA